MEYRILPHGGERIGVLGLGMGGIMDCPETEIEQVVRSAIAHGINFFDLCAGGKNVYAPFGRAIAGQREKVLFQLHFGAVYDAEGKYGWSRDRAAIRDTFEWEMRTLNVSCADFGFLHCVDEDSDVDKLAAEGILDYVQELKAAGRVRHLGFSSHSPRTAQRILDMLPVDMMMFSINPAYDMEQGDELGIGSCAERAALFRRCEAEGVGISVMKPFCAGKLLDAKTSPFKMAMTRYQCLQYALDRPGVLTAVPGVRGLSDLQELLGFTDAPEEEREYAVIGGFTPAAARGTCVYCNHCQPCPAGIDIGLVNKYYDLALAGDGMAAGHYEKLSVKADACLSCGHCDGRCPFKVRQSERMKEIAAYFRKEKNALP
ncbi:aldo/keto reductase [uncultured Mailhella sp.]|uniref:aldo/keto reductase n=1 Tax=uncultured Mailhella sp. TaxID=1981031 RepID=UPI00262984D9|nr:aldo/keto reductase [uncultured Mailhella sp.]